ncbi:MAG: hypothetical protein RL417_2103, partial [Pseudomonadota bacterium]
DCIVNLAYTVVPVFPRRSKVSGELATVSFRGATVGSVRAGEVAVIRAVANQRGDLRIEPRHSAVDVGAGPGLAWEREVEIGQCGVILDGRNRPLESSGDTMEQSRTQERIERELGLLAERMR